MSYASLQQSVEAGQPLLHDRFTDTALPMSQDAFENLLWVKLADACEQADEEMFLRRFFRRVANVLGPIGVQRWQEEAIRFSGR